MNYRKFGNTDLHVSEVGFGAWAIGGEARVGGIPIGWGPADDAVSTQAIHAALDAGINFFDTADFYGLGHSETLLGNVLPNNAIIATKVGQRNIDDKIVLDYSHDYILQACEASLKRLKRDTIDYYQLHNARMPDLFKGECIEAMEMLKQQGKIRYWGLSLNTFAPAPEAEWMMEHKLGDGFQLVFNLINQRAYNVMQQAAKNGYGIIARMPLQFGLLTGKFSAESTFAANDHRSFRLTPEIIEKTMSVLKHVNAAKALSFILTCKEVSTVIPGIRTPEHVKQNTTGIQTLSPEEHERLRSIDWQPVMELLQKQG